ncbi:MAG: chemotaxis protein CheW [Treponema sp.]|nr:chemotaxis protein CheW [Treponema sp.]
MTIESILISDEEATNLNTVQVNTDSEQDRKAQDVIDFKMVTFSLSGKDYAIDIMYVKEIAKAGMFTYVPNTLPFVVGVYNLRGEIIPILDMRIFFNIDVPEQKPDSLSNLLILTFEEQTFGIIVDKIDKVVGVQKSSIQPSHPLFVDINIKYISGVVESNKRLYILLDITRIFSKTKDEEEYKQEARRASMTRQIEASYNESKNAKKAENSVAKEEAATDDKAEPAEKKAAVVPQEEVVTQDPDYKFVVEGLKTYGKFTVSELNEGWVKHRYSEWKNERAASNVQIQNEADAKEFLKSFWSQGSESIWSKEFADEVYDLLPDNSAKQLTVWNPGCSNGSETYSLACVLSKRYPNAKIRIYAQDTDLLGVSNAPMLSVSAEQASGWVSPFVSKKANGEATFNQQIKDSIMFEYHDCKNTNALPMIDLIFARDLLSLMDDESQKSVLADFEEKLKGNGTIFLGENESISHLKDFSEHSKGDLTAYSKQ